MDQFLLEAWCAKVHRGNSINAGFADVGCCCLSGGWIQFVGWRAAVVTITMTDSTLTTAAIVLVFQMPAKIIGIARFRVIDGGWVCGLCGVI